MKLTNRREVLKSIATAGALLGNEIAGRPIELAITAATSQTVRITIQPIANDELLPIPRDGALVQAEWGTPALRWRSIAGTRHVKCGSLTVDVSASPFTIRVTQKGSRVVQEIKLDTATGKLTFPLGDAPVLGLGQGGPQFDRRGSIDRMGNGQGAYRLATHGARVPVQFTNKARAGLSEHKPTNSTEEITSRQRELAAKIRALRPEAKRGDIFTTSISAEFHRLIGMSWKGSDARHMKASFEHSEPVRVPLQINREYPAGIPLQSTPPTLLRNLPTLPKELEYRVVGRRLVLRDITADLIVDFTGDIIP